MSRYRPTADGKVAYVGEDIVSVIDLEGARGIHASVLGWAAETPWQSLAEQYRAWADDIAAAIATAEDILAPLPVTGSRDSRLNPPVSA